MMIRRRTKKSEQEISLKTLEDIEGWELKENCVYVGIFEGLIDCA